MKLDDFKNEFDEMMKNNDEVRERDLYNNLKNEMDYDDFERKLEKVTNNTDYDIIKTNTDLIYTNNTQKSLDYEFNRNLNNLSKGENISKPFDEYTKDFEKNVAVFSKTNKNDTIYKDKTGDKIKEFLKNINSEYKKIFGNTKDLFIKKQGNELILNKKGTDYSKDLSDRTYKLDKNREKTSLFLKVLKEHPTFNQLGNKPYLRPVKVKNNRGEIKYILGTTKKGIDIDYGIIPQNMIESNKTDIDYKKEDRKDFEKVILASLEPLRRASAFADRVVETNNRNNEKQLKNTNDKIDKADIETDKLTEIMYLRHATLEYLVDDKNHLNYPDLMDEYNRSFTLDLVEVEDEEFELNKELEEDELEKNEVDGVNLEYENDYDQDGIGNNVDKEPTIKNEKTQNIKKDYVRGFDM